MARKVAVTWSGVEAFNSGDGAARVTWSGAEITNSGAGPAWVTWSGAEVFNSGSGAAQVSWSGVEVFSALPVGSILILTPPTGHIGISGFPPTFNAGQQVFTPATGHIVIGGFTPVTTFRPWFDWRAAVISQYANSPTIVQVAELFNEWVAPGANFEAFYSLIWNVDTAQGYGLDVWGRIVGIGRVLQLPGDVVFFGFEESTTEVGFNQAQFYDGATPVTSNYALSDTAYRELILAKALANICNGSIPAINQILINLFGASGQAYVTDGEDMTMTYTFDFTLSPVQLAIVQNSGVLPKPAGVSVSIVQP